MKQAEKHQPEAEPFSAFGLVPEALKAWKRTDLTKKERSQIRHWRYLRSCNQCTPEKCAEVIAIIEANSRASHMAADCGGPVASRLQTQSGL